MRSTLGAVLVVDDDPRSVDVLCRILARDGIEAVPATSGADAVAIATTTTIDCLVLDVSMPGMDGFEVCEHLASDERTRAIPIILLTGRNDDATRSTGMRLGVSEFLVKPVVKEELRARVRAQLRTRARVREIDETLSRL